MRHDIMFTIFNFYRCEDQLCPVLTLVGYEGRRIDTVIGKVPYTADSSPIFTTLTKYMSNNDHVSCMEDVERYQTAMLSGLMHPIDVTPECFKNLLEKAVQ